MAMRKRIRKGKSKKVFRRTSGSHKKNFGRRSMRGGIRL